MLLTNADSLSPTATLAAHLGGAFGTSVDGDDVDGAGDGQSEYVSLNDNVSYEEEYLSLRPPHRDDSERHPHSAGVPQAASLHKDTVKSTHPSEPSARKRRHGPDTATNGQRVVDDALKSDNFVSNTTGFGANGELVVSVVLKSDDVRSNSTCSTSSLSSKTAEHHVAAGAPTTVVRVSGT